MGDLANIPFMFVAIGQGFSGLSFLSFGWFPEFPGYFHAQRDIERRIVLYILVSFRESSFVLEILQG